VTSGAASSALPASAGSERAWWTKARTMSRPGTRARNVSAENTTAVSANTNSQRRPGPGRSSAHGLLALPRRVAGEPPHSCPSGTSPSTQEPDSIAASRPMFAHVPDAQHVAVEPVPRQVDLGLDRAPGAEREHAGDRRQRVQVDVAPDLRT